MKSWKRIAVAACIALAAGIFPVQEPVLTAHATSSTWQQIQEANREKEALEKQLNDTRENLDGLKDTHDTLTGELNNLNTELTQVSSNLEELEQKIKDKEADIVRTQEALEEAKETEAWQYEGIVTRVRNMYESSEVSYVNAFLDAGSFSHMLDAEDYYEQIVEYDQMQFQKFQENRQLIESQEAQLLSDRAELENLKVSAEAEKNKVSGLIGQTSSVISQYSDQISEAEKNALEYEENIRKTEENLEYLQQKLKEEIAMSQQAANASWRDISEVSFAEGDRYLLANLIYCEAGGEPYDGQVAVGSVVINRVLSSVYPDSVVGVIYQNKQFSPVGSGRLELALASNKATASCYRAADEAMSGVTNVGTCVYFRTPVEGLTGISIGGHIFY